MTSASSVSSLKRTLLKSGGTSGAQVRPSKDSVPIYLRVDEIDRIIALAIQHGGSQSFPRTQTDGYGFAVEIEDSEGNRIGLPEPQ